MSRTGESRGQDPVIPVTVGTVSSKWAKGTGGPAGDECYNLVATAHTLRGDGFDASEDDTGRGTPLVPISFDARQSDVIQYGDKTGPLDTDGHTMGVMAFAQNQRDEVRTMDVAGALASEPGMKQRTYVACETADTLSVGSNQTTGFPGDITASGMCVRRLTPVECARLMGFSDDYLDITYRGKPAADGNKYKALGNSMAVPVMRWIGQRIQQVQAISDEAEQ